MSTTHCGADIKLVQRPSLAVTVGTIALMRFMSAWRAARNRLAVNQLSDLDDRMLDDIGLSRRDVDVAIGQSGALQDPSSLLARAARERARTRFATPPVC